MASAVILAASIVLMLFSGFMLLRNNAVYRERLSWFDAREELEVGDPDFWRKANFNKRVIRYHTEVRYETMLNQFWKPVRSWRPPLEEWRKFYLNNPQTGSGGCQPQVVQ